ncbi:uncharacterized protein LOC106870819 isoform X3 [Octopus bimaculoides]|uniref:uncharacterized protein LOC106870819 isoform X3 n=1 Tax=Octopus bimaculoides TaxID=37653 RepID=UPI0022E0C4B8|nr:uncharacterized protein LOC106870819 isoform X3 [Octopus bimaculoides]
MAFKFKEFLSKNWIHLLVLVSVIAIFVMEIVQLRQSRTFVDTSTPEYIGRIKFPGYFRTEEEQKTWAKLTPGRELVGSVCCQSNVSWTTPIQMEDITGNMRDIAQYQNLKQFYYTSQCNLSRLQTF